MVLILSYSWKCFHLSTRDQAECPYCKELLALQDVYPLFIENEHVEADEIELPDRPPPRNLPKIVNTAIISAQTEQSRDNIAMGRPLAGTLFNPALAVSAWVLLQ